MINIFQKRAVMWDKGVMWVIAAAQLDFFVGADVERKNGCMCHLVLFGMLGDYSW